MNQQLTDQKTRLYEVRLLGTDGKTLIFATAAASDQEALDYADQKMQRHPSERGELWCGMRLIRRL